MGASCMKRTVILAALLFAGCHSTPSQTHNPVDAGTTFVPDAGPPQCTVSCHEVPDAGVDAGYQAQPLTITAVVPHRAPVTGGTSVQITGSGFMQTFAGDATQAPAQSTLLVGGNPALDYTVISDGIAEFTAPPGNAGNVDVVLSNPNGTATCPGCFTYYAPVLLQTVSPTNGLLAGGTVVTLVGKGLTPDTVVLFGDKTATSVTLDATTGNLSATPPGEVVGSVDVRVFNPVGTSSLLQAFRYIGAPLLTASSPAGGPIAGGTAVNLQGRGLADLSACSIGPNAATLLIQDDGHGRLVAGLRGQLRHRVHCSRGNDDVEARVHVLRSLEHVAAAGGYWADARAALGRKRGDPGGRGARERDGRDLRRPARDHRRRGRGTCSWCRRRRAPRAPTWMSRWTRAPRSPPATTTTWRSRTCGPRMAPRTAERRCSSTAPASTQTCS